MAHTPGPWSVHGWGGDDNTNENLDILGPDDVEVCVLREEFDDNGDPIRHPLCMQDDARLIAAAPELLSVLERCNNRWDDADEEDNPALGQAIRAVIAKATGKESE